jgi:hypothetical protein
MPAQNHHRRICLAAGLASIPAEFPAYARRRAARGRLVIALNGWWLITLTNLIRTRSLIALRGVFAIVFGVAVSAWPKLYLLPVRSYHDWVRLGGSLDSREIQAAAGVTAVRGVLGLPRIAGEPLLHNSGPPSRASAHRSISKTSRLSDGLH